MAAPMAALTVAVNNMLSDREKTFARWSTDSVGSPKVTDIYEITDEVIGEGIVDKIGMIRGVDWTKNYLRWIRNCNKRHQ